MKALLICAALLTLAAAPASAAVIDFEGLNGADLEGPLGYYAGGAGSQGTTGGANLGVTFSSNAIVGVAQGFPNANLNTINPPSGSNAMTFLGDDPVVMNVAGGFTGVLAFSYAAPFSPGTVNIWSGANATGSLLASLAMPNTPDGGDDEACEFTNFCTYAPFSISFAGVAGSASFGGIGNQAIYDNIAFTAAEGGAVPEPGTWALFITGFGLLGAALRRRQRLALVTA